MLKQIYIEIFKFKLVYMKKSIQKTGAAAAPPVSEQNLSVMRDVIKSHISKSEILKNLKTDLRRATSSKPSSHEALE